MECLVVGHAAEHIVHEEERKELKGLPYLCSLVEYLRVLQTSSLLKALLPHPGLFRAGGGTLADSFLGGPLMCCFDGWVFEIALMQ